MSKRILVNSIVLIISILIAELVLRHVVGVVPGIGTMGQTELFNLTNDLKVLRGYKADSVGITRMDYSTAVELESMKTRGLGIKDFNWELQSLYRQVDRLNKGPSEFDFASHYHKISNSKTLTDLDSAIAHYSNHPINKEGFRSIAFKQYNVKSKKVLLIGDSFTYGHFPESIFQSFSDFLLTKNLIIYNSGVSSTDPANYLAVAKKYIPVLQPDYVIVNLYLGNDVFYYKRRLQPFQPAVYSTNAGEFYSNFQGCYNFDSAQEAYDHCVNELTIPVGNGILKPVYLQTALGTLVWKILEKTGLVNSFPNITCSPKEKLNYPSCNDDLQEIQQIATENNCIPIIIVIPEYFKTGLSSVNDYPELLTGMKYYTAPVSQNDYELESKHYNQAGHKKHGKFILNLIKQD